MNWEKWSTKGKSSRLIRKGTLSSLKAPLFTCILSEQKPEIRTDCSVLSEEKKLLPLTEPTICSTDIASDHPNNCLTTCYHPLYKSPVFTLRYITSVWKIGLPSSSKLILTIDQIVCHMVSELFYLLCNIGFSS